jgi:integrase
MATDRDGANLGKANLHGASLVGALTIRDLLGHSSVTMTDRYMHSDQADLHDAVHKLEKFRSHSGHSAR